MREALARSLNTKLSQSSRHENCGPRTLKVDKLSCRGRIPDTIPSSKTLTELVLTVSLTEKRLFWSLCGHGHWPFPQSCLLRHPFSFNILFFSRELPYLTPYQPVHPLPNRKQGITGSTMISGAMERRFSIKFSGHFEGETLAFNKNDIAPDLI